jgi:hypothetical protein
MAEDPESDLPERAEQSKTEVDRRHFLGYAAGAAGLVQGLPLALAALAAAPSTASAKPKPERKRRTFFFNFSHERDAATANYYLVAGKLRYRLRALAPNDHALAQERLNNRFLQQVPNAALTHVLENAALPADAVALCYTVKNPDPTGGTWSLSSMYTSIPESGVSYAYNRARERTALGPLALSAKRKQYGHPPAQTLEDLLEEQAVFDTTDHAATLISLHPDMLSGEPNSAAHVQGNHIQSNGATTALSVTIQALGDAQPQQSPGAPNATGWATLVPITNDDTNQPFRNQKGNNKGLIQYTPDWNPAIDAIAGQGAVSIAPGVKNDESLGTDITGSDGTSQPSGALWARHDGFPTVDQSSVASGASVEDAVSWTLTDKSVDQGLLITATVAEQSGGPQVTLTCANWYVRWIGIYLQFLKSDGTPIPVAELPSNTIPDNNPASNTTDALFGSMVSPEFTILAIPVAAGYSTVVFNMPSAARTVRILGSGLGFGSVTYPDTVVPGAVMTIGVNFGLATFFLIAGASDKLSPFVKAAISPVGQLLAQELVTLLAADLKSPDAISQPGTWKSLGLTLLKAFLGYRAGQTLTGIITGIVVIVTGSEFEDAIPIVGQIMRVIAAIVGVANLEHTLIDVLASPWSYVYEMVFTHPLSVKILHDPGNNQFPATANYYKVTALFDSGGTPFTQTLPISNGTKDLKPVVFQNVPLGGMVNLSTAFYSRSSDPAQNDWLAAKGTTGLVSNSMDQAPNLTIEEFKVPIKSNTAYVHSRKTTLVADGDRVWDSNAPAPTAKVADATCGGVGSLCDFRNITVRQGTSAEAGYLGYAWKGYSSGVTGCVGGGVGQFDQLANINTGADPQTGYAPGPCGLPDGTRIAYSPLTQPASNFYFDSNAGIVRQVQLDPPGFDPPSEHRAWGKFNLRCDALLLHPTGKLVSISSAESRIETLRLPAKALSDADASVQLIAQVHAGQGTRAGLIDTPAAAAISPEGVILLLEQNNNRIQAFDTGANPVKFFAKQTSPYFLNLDATAGGDTVYLDLAVEFTGYLYVLSYNQATNLYRLDIYHPGQSDTTPISTTHDVNAAKLTVDYWRNVYTLNYEVLLIPPGGAVPAITEPSVSMWIPKAT